MRLVHCGLAALLTVLLTPSAFAQTATNNLTATMMINAGCTVSSGIVDFGTQSVLGANVDQTGSFNVTCTNTTPYTIALDAGANGASVSTRRLRGGGSNTEHLNYALYTTAARSVIWGTTSGTNTVSSTGSGSGQSITVYGRVPAQAVGSPGTYTDTVTITVSY